MLKTLINAWNIKDIRTRMLYTLLLIVVYRFGSFIPVPFVDAAQLSAAASQYDILGFLNLLSGGNFSQFTIFAMGISPYITGSIIIQLLTIAKIVNWLKLPPESRFRKPRISYWEAAAESCAASTKGTGMKEPNR